MQQQKVTRNQVMFSIVLFNLGTSVVMGVGTTTVQDTWISILAATLMAALMFLIYSRILALFPDKNLFQIAEHLFGPVGGKVISVLFFWYALHLAALVLKNFSAFTQLTVMPETPELPIMILMALTAIYLAGSGMRTIGKWAVAGCLFVMGVVLFTFGASVHQMELGKLLPVLSHPPDQILQTTLQVFSYPYAETVLFLCVGDSIGKDAKTRKVFLTALGITALIFLLVCFRNLTILGQAFIKTTYFPSFVTARLLHVGSFLERLESSISANFFIAGLAKISVCLLAAAKGLANLFSQRESKHLVLAVGMLALALCAVLFHDAMEMFLFARYSFYYGLPFQVLIPIVLWLTGEWRVRQEKHAEAEELEEGAA